MKRDMELVRKLLITIEEMESKADWKSISIDGYEKPVIDHHIVLLKDAGLLLGPPAVTFEDAYFGRGRTAAYPVPDPRFFYLSWEGHEFLDAARDDTRWRKAMGRAKEAGGALTFAALQTLLANLMSQALGLGP